MGEPYLDIRTDTIAANARAVVDFCGSYGIEVWGVSKGCCGLPEAARAMLSGGVAGIGESRIDNMRRIRQAGIETPALLLRLPHPSEARAIVETFDLSLNSGIETVRALSSEAAKLGKRHGVILMVDLGDLREGLWPDRVLETAGQVAGLESIELLGIGTNLTCYGGVIPSETNLGLLVDLARDIERVLGIRLKYVSGGNSSSLPLIAAGRMPRGVNMLRIGEAILLGRESVKRSPWRGTRQDAFSLHAEVIERARKPSVPIGERGQDGFGGYPVFEDRGLIERAIVNIGRQDIRVENLSCLDPAIRILGASSDHLILDVSNAASSVEVGDFLGFDLGYGALLRAMTSPYVEKRIVRPPGEDPESED